MSMYVLDCVGLCWMLLLVELAHVAHVAFIDEHM